MNNLSAMLAEIETSVANVKRLEAELTIEKDRGQKLAVEYRAASGEVLKTLGLDAPKKARKVRSQDAILLGTANRKIKQLVAGGEKNQKAILTAVIEAVAKTAAIKFSVTELSAELKSQIEEKVKGIGVKK